MTELDNFLIIILNGLVFNDSQGLYLQLRRQKLNQLSMQVLRERNRKLSPFEGPMEEQGKSLPLASFKLVASCFFIPNYALNFQCHQGIFFDFV